MPANLPPQYFEAERKLKTAKSPQEKIVIYEELLSIIPKHKGTEKLRALLKTKIAKLKSSSQKSPALARHHPGFAIEKTGAGQVVLVGLPNSGKSTLVKSLTNAEPEIGDYPFTTRIPSPGMMAYENVQVQLVDTPPIMPDAIESWHAELIKGSDCLLLLLDLSAEDPVSDFQTLVNSLKEKRIEIVPEGHGIPPEKQPFLKKALIAANKKDATADREKILLLETAIPQGFQMITISAEKGENIEECRTQIFSLLEVLRVYSKAPGKKASREEPFIFKKGSTLMDMAKAVHKDFAEKLRYARIWGKNKYQGQKVNKDYILEDEDIIELHI